jgi:hypothetical protein
MNSENKRNEKYLTYTSVSGFLFTSSLGTVLMERPPKMVNYYI